MTTASLAAHRQPTQSRWQSARRGLAAWQHKTSLKARRASVHVLGPQAVARRLVLTAAALGSIDTGAFLANAIAGFVFTGVSLLVFNECMN